MILRLSCLAFLLTASAAKLHAGELQDICAHINLVMNEAIPGYSTRLEGTTNDSARKRHLLEFKTIFWQFSNAKDVWAKYQQNVADTPAKKPLRGGRLQPKAGEIPKEIESWTNELNNILEDRDTWVQWNYWFMERIRLHAMRTNSPIYDAMMAVIHEEAKDRGFPTEILILKKFISDLPGWRKMLSQGKLFVYVFTTRGNEGNHTLIVHLLQLLYVQRMLEANGHPPGYLRTIMKEYLGNHQLVENLTFMSDNAQGESGYGSPWYNFFDGAEQRQVSNPEWFGYMWHLLGQDIPYDQIRERNPANYP